MDQIIVGGIALLAFWWSVRVMSGKMVPAPVRVAKSDLLRRVRTRF